jgi:hypothetical protein
VVDIRVSGGALRGVEVGPELVARTIDEYPILAIAGAVAEGVTRFVEVKRIACKRVRSHRCDDRRTAQSRCPVEASEDSMTIVGAQSLKGGAVRSFADHRVAMAFADRWLGKPRRGRDRRPSMCQYFVPDVLRFVGANLFAITAVTEDSRPNQRGIG